MSATVGHTAALPETGSRWRVWIPGGIERVALILGYDSNREDALVRWIDYDLPDEWIPVRWL